MMSMFWLHGVGRAEIQLVSETRWLAGRISKLSFRSGRKKFAAHLQMPDQAMGLVLVATGDPADARVHGVGEGKIDEWRDFPPK